MPEGLTCTVGFRAGRLLHSKCELTFSNDVLEDDDSSSDGSDTWVEWYYGPTDLNTFGTTT